MRLRGGQRYRCTLIERIPQYVGLKEIWFVRGLCKCDPYGFWFCWVVNVSYLKNEYLINKPPFCIQTRCVFSLEDFVTQVYVLCLVTPCISIIIYRKGKRIGGRSKVRKGWMSQNIHDTYIHNIHNLYTTYTYMCVCQTH